MPVITFNKKETNSVKKLYEALAKEKGIKESFSQSLCDDSYNMGGEAELLADGSIIWIMPEDEFIAMANYGTSNMSRIMRVYNKLEAMVKLVHIVMKEVGPELKALGGIFSDSMRNLREQKHFKKLKKLSNEDLHATMLREQNLLVDNETERAAVLHLMRSEEDLFGEASKKSTSLLSHLDNMREMRQERVRSIMNILECKDSVE